MSTTSPTTVSSGNNPTNALSNPAQPSAKTHNPINLNAAPSPNLPLPASSPFVQTPSNHPILSIPNNPTLSQPSSAGAVSSLPSLLNMNSRSQIQAHPSATSGPPFYAVPPVNTASTSNQNAQSSAPPVPILPNLILPSSNSNNSQPNSSQTSTGLSAASSASANSNSIFHHSLRFMEFLDHLKMEYEAIFNELHLRKSHQDELEFQLQTQLNEFLALQKYVQDLEMSHLRLKQKYEQAASTSYPEIRDQIVQNLATQEPPKLILKTPSDILGKSDLKLDSTLKPDLPLQRQDSLRAFDKKTSSELPQKSSIDENLFHYKNDLIDSSGFHVTLLHTLDHDAVVCSVAFSNDGRFLATGSSRFVHLFDVEYGNLVTKLQDPSFGDLFCRSITFSPDSKFLICGAEDKLIRIWEMDTFKLAAKLSGHSQDIYSISFHPTLPFLASASSDILVKIWDLNEGVFLCNASSPPTESSESHPVISDNASDTGIVSVSFSPCGKFLVSASLDGVLRLYAFTLSSSPKETLQELTLLQTIERAHDDSIYSIAFSPDGRFLISASLDKLVSLWEFTDESDTMKAARLSKIEQLQGHKDFVLSVAFLGDSNYFVSGSKDRQLLFWKLTENHNGSVNKSPETQQEQQLQKTSTTAVLSCSLSAHKNSIIALAVAKPYDRHLFATGSGDKKAKIWSYSFSSSSK